MNSWKRPGKNGRAARGLSPKTLNPVASSPSRIAMVTVLLVSRVLSRNHDANTAPIAAPTAVPTATARIAASATVAPSSTSASMVNAPSAPMAVRAKLSVPVIRYTRTMHTPKSAYAAPEPSDAASERIIARWTRRAASGRHQGTTTHSGVLTTHSPSASSTNLAARFEPWASPSPKA